LPEFPKAAKVAALNHKSISTLYRQEEKLGWNCRTCFGATILVVVQTSLEYNGCLIAVRKYSAAERPGAQVPTFYSSAKLHDWQ
jgi:hypothetical protein